MTNRFLKLAFVLIVCSVCAFAGDKTIQSVWSDTDPVLDANPASAFWRGAQPIYMERDKRGKPDSKYRTEIRTRWTRQNLYFLFVCPYEELWNWDVAEVFVGSDFKEIRRYKEFEMSPQGEWIDLDIDLSRPHHEDGWKWNSAFEVSARVDSAAHVWYGAMRIPYSAIDSRPAATGNTLRINLFRSQGPASARHQIAWQAPMSDSFHLPERFGTLKLVRRQE
jgi:hypothetical protein